MKVENLKNEKSVKYCLEFSNDKGALESLLKNIEVKRELIEMNENLTTHKIYIKNLETQREINFLFSQKIFLYTLDNGVQKVLDNFLCVVLMYIKIMCENYNKDLFNIVFTQENIDCLPC